jgi:hypothetical protein
VRAIPTDHQPPRTRKIRTGINDANTGKAKYDPRASGVPKAITAMPEYMGCLAAAYGRLRTTRCLLSTRIVLAAKLFVP